jgi:hypothetical protein
MLATSWRLVACPHRIIHNPSSGSGGIKCQPVSIPTIALVADLNNEDDEGLHRAGGN